MTQADPQAQTPRYYLLEATFFAPDLVPAGSIVDWPGGFHPGLKPLNDAANAVADAWYDKEFTYTVDDPANPGVKMQVKHRPRAELRPVEGQAPDGNSHVVQIIRDPPREGLQGLSLANVNANRPSTDQRPGPVKAALTPDLYGDMTAEPPTEPNESGVVIAKPGPAPTVGSIAPSTISVKKAS